MAIVEIILLIYSICTTLIVVRLKVKYQKREMEYLNESIEREKKYGKALDTIKILMEKSNKNLG